MSCGKHFLRRFNWPSRKSHSEFRDTVSRHAPASGSCEQWMDCLGDFRDEDSRFKKIKN